jgi:hypothetical protein
MSTRYLSPETADNGNMGKAPLIKRSRVLDRAVAEPISGLRGDGFHVETNKASTRLTV